MNENNDSSQTNLVSNLRLLVKSINDHSGAWSEDRSTKVDNEIELNLWTDPVALDAMRFLYDNNLIINFDWANWDEGREFFEDNNSDKFTKLDKEWVLKLLSAVARNDRFNDGAWANLFESGDAQKLFNRLLEIEEL